MLARTIHRDIMGGTDIHNLIRNEGIYTASWGCRRVCTGADRYLRSSMMTLRDGIEA